MFPHREFSDVYVGTEDRSELKSNNERAHNAYIHRNLFPVLRVEEGNQFLRNRELNTSREFRRYTR